MMKRQTQPEQPRRGSQVVDIGPRIDARAEAAIRQMVEAALPDALAMQHHVEAIEQAARAGDRDRVFALVCEWRGIPPERNAA